MFFPVIFIPDTIVPLGEPVTVNVVEETGIEPVNLTDDDVVPNIVITPVAPVGCWDTEYVPTPPVVPVNWDDINVPGTIVPPDIVIPNSIVPVGIPTTVNVVEDVAIEPLNEM